MVFRILAGWSTKQKLPSKLVENSRYKYTGILYNESVIKCHLCIDLFCKSKFSRVNGHGILIFLVPPVTKLFPFVLFSPIKNERLRQT